MEWHEASNVFPMMGAEDLEDLAEDIKQNGLLHPIVLHPDGSILDGRNRQTACVLAGVEPRYDTWNGEGNELSFVVSENLMRRQLTTEQRGMVAARLKDKFAEEAKQRQQARKGNQPGTTVDCSPYLGRARDKAGESMGVSGKTVDRCEKVLQQGSDELIAAVDGGNVSADAAAKLAELPKEKQREVLKEATAADNPRKALADTSKRGSQLATEDEEWLDDECARKQQVLAGTTVVANSKRDTRLIKWAEAEGICVHVGRGTPWGNPFIHKKDGTRDEVCDNYAWYLDRKPSLDAKKLSGRVLVCWCYPERCHADELARRACR